jgi:uncharacterized repeat protein (TIGR03803 family)
MGRNRSFVILSAALLILTMAFLVLPAGAWAARVYTTLYRFEPKGGDIPQAGLVFDQAGNLYGTTSSDGKGYMAGMVFKLTPSADGGWTESVLYSFCSLENCSDGASPTSGLIFDKTGNLYGTTAEGGAFNEGTVFKLAPNQDGTWTESVLYSFLGGSNGAIPIGGLIFDRAGNLYGTTNQGGSTQCPQGCGVVFKVTPSNGIWTQSVLYSFCALSNCSDDGEQPTAGLIFDQAGNLYGTTPFGANSGGIVFELTPSRDRGWSESVLHRFCSLSDCRDGGAPFRDLIFDQAGNLYGTGAAGGDLDAGVVFRLTPNRDGSWTESVLHSFCSRTNCIDGQEPFSRLIFDQTGNLYGTTISGGNSSACGTEGCGVVFKLAPKSNGRWEETVLHNFLNHPGVFPVAGVILDTAGNLYGTTGGDSSGPHGSAFKIAP